MKEAIWTVKAAVEASCFVTPDDQHPVFRVILVNGDAECYLEIDLSAEVPVLI